MVSTALDEGALAAEATLLLDDALVLVAAIFPKAALEEARATECTDRAGVRTTVAGRETAASDSRGRAEADRELLLVLIICAIYTIGK